MDWVCETCIHSTVVYQSRVYTIWSTTRAITRIVYQWAHGQIFTYVLHARTGKTHVFTRTHGQNTRVWPWWFPTLYVSIWMTDWWIYDNIDVSKTCSTTHMDTRNGNTGIYYKNCTWISTCQAGYLNTRSPKTTQLKITAPPISFPICSIILNNREQSNNKGK